MPEQLTENTILVLDHGFVALDGALASDLSVVNGARVSFNQVSDEMAERDQGLIRFLMREGHGSPFEHGYFRFIVKAPALVTDASVRGDRGEPVAANPCFLNAELAAREFVEPCLAGLGKKAGALVFQFPPLPDPLLADPAAFVERLAAFLAALPPLPEPAEPADGGDGPCYAVEIRDAILLTPRFVRTLRAAGVRYCVGLHARMPDPLRQAAALALMDGETPAGPLIVRWSLHSGFKYEQAKARYEPFDKLVDEDPHTRVTLAELAARYAMAGQPVLITTNNKAEGSAPLTCAKLARAIADEMERLRGEMRLTPA